MSPPLPDHAAARKLVLELMGLAGVSGDEKAVAECVVKHLRAAGCPQQAVRAIGRTPRLEVSNGGLDANWMAVHGIPTVTLGCGQMEIHTTQERLDLEAFEAACTVALRLAVGQEGAG